MKECLGLPTLSYKKNSHGKTLCHSDNDNFTGSWGQAWPVGVVKIIIHAIPKKWQYYI